MIDKKNFNSSGFGWELVKSNKFFLGKEVCISIDTKIDSEHSGKQIFDEQIKTTNRIYQKWESLATIIEKEILAYEKITKEKLQKVLDSPRIWLAMDEETNQPRRNSHWTFVLGVAENEDFGWHVEFENEVHIETWAGG